MKAQMIVVAVGCATAVLATGCATKKFVREEVGKTETALGQRVDGQQAELRQNAERTTQAIEATNQRLGEVNTVATDARKEAGAVGQALRETDQRLTQRFANRNKYSALEKKSIYFDFAKADLRDEGINELEEIARALKADPNMVLELQGYADARGTDAYNHRLTRERVDAVIRYLVQRHGIELRRLHAVGMGKAPLAAGTRPSRDVFAKSRRVDIVLLAPQS
jgi:outer membrane protein OmpA-like peptidoglycan-associated protein